MKKEQLKDACRQRSLSVTGNKPDLVTDVYLYSMILGNWLLLLSKNGITVYFLCLLTLVVSLYETGMFA